jgi:hypothetical protein
MEHTRIDIYFYTQVGGKKNWKIKYDTSPPPSSYITRDTGGEQMVKKKVKLEIMFSEKKLVAKLIFQWPPILNLFIFTFFLLF